MSNPDGSSTCVESHAVSGAGIPANGPDNDPDTPPPGPAVSAVLLGLPEVINGVGGALPLDEPGIECELRVPLRITVGAEQLDTDVFLAAGRRPGTLGISVWAPKRGTYRPGATDWLDARYPNWRPVLDAQIAALEVEILREHAQQQQQRMEYLIEEQVRATHPLQSPEEVTP